jgi:GNAT superfamily N-acetyltransferase
MASFAGRDETVQVRLPRGILVRRGLESDEPATFDVMRRAMGFDMSWAQHVRARRHMRSAPHSSYWVADETPRFGKSRIIGYAHSMVRDGVWHLTEFFVLPSHHRQGVGSTLLDACLRDGADAGAHTRFVLASHHPAADALYMRKADCFARLPMFLLAGPTLALHPIGTRDAPIHDTVMPPFTTLFLGAPERGRDDLPLHAEPLLPTPETHAVLDALDRKGVGFARPEEHAHWMVEMGGPAGAARLFRLAGGPNRGKIVGYAYYGRHNSGPALALDAADLPRMLTHVANIARVLDTNTSGETGLVEPGEPYFAVPGVNEIMLRWLLRFGWQIVFQYLFMSSRPLGEFDRYVCHNPLHFL